MSVVAHIVAIGLGHDFINLLICIKALYDFITITCIFCQTTSGFHRVLLLAYSNK